MYFKVRCLREPIRILISIFAFLISFTLLAAFLRPLVYRLFSSTLDDGWILFLSAVGAGAVELICQTLLRIYKVYEFTDRAINVVWWYGGWWFFLRWIDRWIDERVEMGPRPRPKRNKSPLLYREKETPTTTRGYPDEFEPELIQEHLAQGALPDSVLGTSKTVRTVHRDELHDVMILESAFGATLLLRLWGCGEFTERFVWQYQLHNRGELFVLRLPKARGEEAYSLIKEYTRR